MRNLMRKLVNVLPAGSKKQLMNCTAAAVAGAAVSVMLAKQDLSRSSDQRVGAGNGAAMLVAAEQAASLPESQVSHASVR